MSAITYRRESNLSTAEFLGVLHRSGLAARRPVDDLERIAAMLANANLVITARDGATLAGVSRCVTDFAYCCYCSDLAVDAAYQRRGIGRALLEATRAALHPNALLLLVAAPAAISYYEHIGMERLVQCFGVRQ
jgi:GNAT superfamily N-acetyltransferase